MGMASTRSSSRARSAQEWRAPLPVHPDVLKDELARVDPESLKEFERECVREAFKRGLVRGNVYAVDATGLHDDWKLVVLCNVTRARGFPGVVAATIRQGV